MTLAVLPLDVLLAGNMFRLSPQSLAEVGLHVRKNVGGYLLYLLYLLTYQLFMFPVSVAGYVQEAVRARLRGRTARREGSRGCPAARIPPPIRHTPWSAFAVLRA